jgi:hypothetical protein
MSSGKGKKCPNCGKAKFHREGQIYRCSNCYQSGWTATDPPRPGGGKGKRCQVCKKNTLHPLLRETKASALFILAYCEGCGATLFRLMIARKVARIPKKPPASSLRRRAEARRGPRANGTEEPAIIDQSTVRVPTGDRKEPKRGEQKR